MPSNQAELRRWNDSFWTSIWPRREALTSSVTDCLLEHLQPRDGESIFEIGSGGGVATLAIAAQVGSAPVVGVDISAPLVELARRRAQERGVTNVAFVLDDLQHAQLDGRPFAGAASQFGIMFFDDPVAAFTNIAAQLAPKGRLVFACWQPAQRNPWSVGPTLARFAPPPAAGAAPPPTPAGLGPPGPFALGHAEGVVALLRSVGFTTITRQRYEQVVTVERDTLFDEGELAFRGVPEADREAARSAVEHQLGELARPDGRYDAPLAFQIFSAR